MNDGIDSHVLKLGQQFGRNHKSDLFLTRSWSWSRNPVMTAAFRGSMQGMDHLLKRTAFLFAWFFGWQNHKLCIHIHGQTHTPYSFTWKDLHYSTYAQEDTNSALQRYPHVYLGKVKSYRRSWRKKLFKPGLVYASKQSYLVSVGGFKPEFIKVCCQMVRE